MADESITDFTGLPRARRRLADNTYADVVVSVGQDALPKPNKGVVSAAAASATSKLILAANPDRLGALILNNTSTMLFVSCSSGPASLTLYSMSIPAGESWQVPFGYTGSIHGIWNMVSDAGGAMVTELTREAL